LGHLRLAPESLRSSALPGDPEVTSTAVPASMFLAFQVPDPAIVVALERLKSWTVVPAAIPALASSVRPLLA
jgi:hypothetical protein